MSTVEERLAYLNNPIKTPPLIGDYTPFYVTIAICTVFGAFLIALNVICACCSKNKDYWQDKHTGNRWIWFGPFWTATPHEQPPCDLSELKDAIIYDAYDVPHYGGHAAEYSVGYHEEEERPVIPPQSRPQRPVTGHHRQPMQEHVQHQRPMEYVELQKRESEI
uniref:CSON003220 protein n=1 Tax=Culicoides sonorensis TaxID=179676 RepID=A0A336LSN1_CULSO